VTSPLRIGIIGLGDFGREHLAAVRAHDGFTVTAVADSSEDRLHSIGESLGGTELFIDARSLIRSGEVDAVTIVSPSATHLALVEAAADAGVAVLVEKPVVTDLREAGRLLELDPHARIVPAHILRSSAPHVAAHDTLVARGAPRLGGLSARRHRNVDHLTRFPTEDPVFMTMVHDIDLAIWMSRARAVSVRARSFQLREPTRTDLVFAVVEDSSGRVWDLASGWLVDGEGPPDRLELYTDAGLLVIQPPDDDLTGAMSEQYTHFEAFVRGEAPPRVTVADAVHGVAIAHAIRESSRRGGRAVDVPELGGLKRTAGTAREE